MELWMFKQLHAPASSAEGPSTAVGMTGIPRRLWDARQGAARIRPRGSGRRRPPLHKLQSLQPGGSVLPSKRV